MAINQKVCVAIGIGFIVVGFLGILVPDLLGMHLSMAHNLIHIVSGSLALWVGSSEEPRKAGAFSVIFGAVYGFLGLVGFVIGQPGYPGVGHLGADQNLIRVVPNVLEFGSSDHVIHIIISGALLFAALVTSKSHTDADRSLVDVQRRKKRFDGSTTTRPTIPNSATDLADAELGQSDINRPADIKHREDFEGRI
ncbi:MAG TPA: hypothetical protein VNJ08_07760 [Bacteriovoracaceae bacterium]|nr:hypothetical protein [Bacteriovoracaceae bacterium]